MTRNACTVTPVVLLILRRRLDILASERFLLMFVLFRLILIAMVAMPQGICCIALGCDQSTKEVLQEATGSAECCNCCRIISESATKSGSSECPPTKSCECSCRFQTSISTPPKSLDSLSSKCCFFDRPVDVRYPPTAICVSTIGQSGSIRLQILYCVWRC